MKLVILIPCLNEERTLPATLADLPRALPGVSTVQILVVDDGSSDGTVAAARAHGAHEVLQLQTRRGLAGAFSAGLRRALEMGADVVAMTDGDNQYRGEDLGRIVAPVIEGRADLVVGCRPIAEHEEFGFAKKCLQRLGSWVLRRISRTTVRDAASGFRAFSRAAALRIFVHSRFTPSMETLIQAGSGGLRVMGVDIRVNPATRPSRLFRSMAEYVGRQALTMLAMFLLYRPLAFFSLLSAPFWAGAGFLGVRFLWLTYWAQTPIQPRTHLPSLILLAVCVVSGSSLLLAGLVASLQAAQRRLIEALMLEVRAKREV